MNSADEYLYGRRASGGGHGDVFTLPMVVCFMLDRVGYTADADLRDVRILEPSCGEGAFVVEIAARLMRSASRFHFDAEEAFLRNVRAYDVDARKVDACRGQLRRLGLKQVWNIEVADFLRADVAPADVVVGNPPYVRYEQIPQEILDYCKASFPTFHYRSDLYVPFFEKSLSLLRAGGRHCFICSNRWLKNEYGKKLRRCIAASYNLRLLVDLGQADAFQEEVLAYPAISLISAEPPGQTFGYAECSEIGQLRNLSVVQKTVPRGGDWTGVFMDMPEGAALFPIERQGFKIGIGVATGADAVFLSNRLAEEVEPELVLPAIGARDLRGDEMLWRQKYLLNPYTAGGKLVDLSCYPKAKCYLETHREQLSRRHIARKSPGQWYRTIDRIDPFLQVLPKILLPDMSGNTFVFVDEGKFYPLHNIYYVTGRSLADLRLLAALLMSDFVRGQLNSVTNKMNGGFLRWQSQYLRKLLLPDIESIPAETRQALLGSYDRKDRATINRLVAKLLEDSPFCMSNKRQVSAAQATLSFF